MGSRKPGATAQVDSRIQAKVFTLDEASRALPLVRRIVQDIVEQYRCVRRLERERRVVARLGRPDEVRAIDGKGHAAAVRFAELIDEVNQIGCEIKDLDKGLVDFPSVHEGRRIELCWMLGEEHIDWWHEPAAGFAGRRSVKGTLV